MKVELEVKLVVPDLTDFLGKLAGLKPRRLSERKFEDNFILDQSKSELSKRGSLLRVRNENGKGTLTFKGPARESKVFKIREEWETECDPTETLALFQRLGYQVVFRYQKYRTIYQTRGADPGGKAQPVYIMIDETPIGNFVELEGSGAAVSRIADRLGYSKRQFLRDSYYSLFVAHCKKKGRSPRDMIFR